MAWLSVIVPALVLAAILYIPGIAVNALFLRKRLYTVGFAPVTGAAILASRHLRAALFQDTGASSLSYAAKSVCSS